MFLFLFSPNSSKKDSNAEETFIVSMSISINTGLALTDIALDVATKERAELKPHHLA